MKVLPTLGSQYSGSLRGITAAHNAGGLYFRGRTVPTNPNTARQQAIRSIIAGLTNEWSDELTEAQRQAWRDYAANVETTDSMGQSITLSGFNWLIKAISAPRQVLNAGLSTTGLQLTPDAPTIFDTGQPVALITTFDGDFTTPPGTIDLAGNLAAAAPADGACVLYIAPPQTNGTRFYAGPYQLAAITTVTAASDVVNFSTVDLSSSSEWASDTVPVAAWDTLFVPLRLVVLYEDGRRSAEFRQLVQFTDATP